MGGKREGGGELVKTKNEWEKKIIIKMKRETGEMRCNAQDTKTNPHPQSMTFRTQQKQWGDKHERLFMASAAQFTRDTVESDEE
jgi:hypothetical protein